MYWPFLSEYLSRPPSESDQSEDVGPASVAGHLGKSLDGIEIRDLRTVEEFDADLDVRRVGRT